MNCVPLGSCNINEVTKTVLNLLFYLFFFFTKRFYTHKKSTKKHKKAPKAQKHDQTKAQKRK